MAPHIRLIAIDIDGTLLDSRGNLPSRNRKAVRRAIDAGIYVVLVTGRAFHHARPVADALSNDIVLIVSNGALTKLADGTTVASRLVPLKTARSIVTSIRRQQHGVAVIFDRLDERQYVYDSIDWTDPNRQWYYERYRAFITRVEPLEAALTDNPVQVACSGSVEDMRALAQDIDQLPASRNVTLTLTEYEARDFSLLDIIARRWSKGAALAEWVQHLKLKAADVMAIGDNLNDREMLEFAGMPVVMGNAVAPLMSLGWPITATHDECGLAEAIEVVLAAS